MGREAAVRLRDNVWRIPTRGDLINSFAFVDDDGGVTLVDCGVVRAPPKIVAGLGAMGKQPGDVKQIVLTHVHPDHVGGAAAVREQTGAPVSVHDADADAARAGRVLARPDRRFLAGRIFDRLNAGKFPAVELGEPLYDDQLLPAECGCCTRPGTPRVTSRSSTSRPGPSSPATPSSTGSAGASAGHRASCAVTSE